MQHHINSTSSSSRQQQHVVGIHYVLGPKIGEGSFGVIFEGENILSNNSFNPVAIKFEPRNSDAPQLRDEFRSYKILNRCEGIPNAYYYGQEGMHNILIIDLLGPSLEDLFEWCGRKFSIKTTCLIAKQMIQRIKDIHNNDLIYRDIKPDNFLISQFQSVSNNKKYITSTANNDANLVYLVDFGMAKQYRDPRTKQHIPYRERKSLSGTARYMSINTHFGREQSRRDDLESLGHVFFYFLRGSLPWQGLKAPNNKLKYEKIGLTKKNLNPTDLLLNNTIPEQFATYLNYSRNLKFEEEPNYDYLMHLMDEVLLQLNLKDDGHYDWMDLNNGKGWDININKRANLHGYGNANPKNNNNSNNINHHNNNKQINRIKNNLTNLQSSSNIKLRSNFTPISEIKDGISNYNANKRQMQKMNYPLKKTSYNAINNNSNDNDDDNNKSVTAMNNRMQNRHIVNGGNNSMNNDNKTGILSKYCICLSWC